MVMPIPLFYHARPFQQVRRMLSQVEKLYTQVDREYQGKSNRQIASANVSQ